MKQVKIHDFGIGVSPLPDLYEISLDIKTDFCRDLNSPWEAVLAQVSHTMSDYKTLS